MHRYRNRCSSIVVKGEGQPQDHTEFGAGSGVQVLIASLGLPLPPCPSSYIFNTFCF